MKISDLNKIILAALLMLIITVITREFMDQYSKIILILAIIGITIILGKSLIDTYFKKNKTNLVTAPAAEIEIKDSQKVQGMINSPNAKQIINQTDSEGNKQLLLQRRFEECQEKYYKVHIYQLIDTYKDMTDDEKADLYDRVVYAKTGSLPKTNKYKTSR